MNQRKKEFWKYVPPSVGGMLVTALYIVVDGIFVGRGVGEEALAAVNIAVPFTTLMIAITMMITMGGAAITSIRMGRGDDKRANESFLISIFMVLVFSIVVSAIGTLFPLGIASISGATKLLINSTSIYIRYYSMFAVFFCMSMALSVFVRNDGNPNLALWGMVSGAVSNIFWDWLFVFPLQMGIKGAAIASGIGQIISLIVLSTHFINKKGKLKIQKPKLNLNLMGKVIKRGLPELVIQMSQPVTILCYNYVVINKLGEIGVSAFSVICYLLTLILGVFIGVSQGIQPLISRSYGENNKDNEKYYFKIGIITNLVISMMVYLVLAIWGSRIISIFNPNSKLIFIAYNAIKVYGLSFIFAAVNIVFVTYFLSTKRTKKAVTIAISRGLVCNVLFIFLFPLIFGIKAIWLGIVIAEFVTMIVSLGIKRLILN